MRKLFMPMAFAICACAAPLSGIEGTGVAFAQSQSTGAVYEGLKQAPLTEAQIDQYIAAQKDMAAIFANAPADAADKPDPKTLAKLQALAKKYKFASYDDLNAVAGNIALVLDGVDPKTKKYVGSDVVLKQTIADVQADPKMTPADKKEALAELNDELKSAAPLKYPTNVDLVLKHYDELAAGEAPSK